MTIKTIPERRMIACDCCGAECTPTNYVHEGKLTLTRAALDFQGAPVADATIRRDLCDRCNVKIGDAINAACIEARAALQQLEQGGGK